jgi:hypothetical protein
VAPSPSGHVSPHGAGTSVLPLLAMAELRGRLESSCLAIRTSGVCIMGLQAHLVIMEARTSSKLLAALFMDAQTLIPFLLPSRARIRAGGASPEDRCGDLEHPRS